MIEKVKENKLDSKVYFIDRVESSELISYTKGADIGINLQEKINISKELASANKIFEYIHAGLPIIASTVPENKLVIEKYQLGILVENEPEQIAEGINKLATIKKENFKEKCTLAALEYNWETEEKILNEIADQLFEGERKVKM